MNQYNQDVNINFQGEDGLSNVVDKLNERLGSLQFKIFLANGALNTFGKRVITNADELAKFTKVLAVTDATFNKVFSVTGIAKIFTILGTGIAEAKDKLDGLNIGLKAMQVSGYDTTIITQFTQLSDAILFNSQALDNFSLSALTAFNRFNKAKSEVATLFPENDPFITNLSSSIQKLVNEDLKNAVTSIDALRASYEAASSGFTDAAENQAVMVAGLKLSKAGGADTGATMKVLAQTISAYGLAASDATKVASILNQTVQLGVTTIPELSNGFAQAAVTANAAKIKLQELGAAVAALTLQGFDTSSALTGIEALSRVIISKTPQATAALRELRDESGKPIKFDIAEIRSKGLTKALDDLNKAAKGNVTVLREIIPEATAYNTALALMANNASKLDEFTGKMFEVSKTGELARKALDSVFGIKLNNQAESFEAIVNRLTEQFIQFGEQLAPFFDTGVKAVESFTKFLSGISPEMKKTLSSILISQLGFAKLTDVIGGLIGTATKAFLAFEGWRFTMMFMNGTIGEQITLIKLLLANNVGIVPVLKQLIGIDQSRLLLNASLSKSEFELVTAKTANTVATNLNTTAAIKNAVTTGKLIEVNGLLGKSYVTNNLLTRVVYADLGAVLSGLVSKTKELVIKTIEYNKAASASGVIFPTFTAIGTAITGLIGKLSGIGGLTAKILNGLKLLAAPLTALTLVGGILYDQFFGTTAQVRKLNSELEKIDQSERKSLITTLEKLEINNKLNKSQQARLERLKIENDLTKANYDIYKSSWAEIGKSISNGISSAIKFADTLLSWTPIIGQLYGGLKEIFNLLGSGFNNFRFDQLLPTLGKIDSAVIKTGDSINDLVKSTKQLQQGFTGLEDIDKLIKAGKILDANAITRIKNEADVRAKESELLIANNDNRINALNEQLKKFDALNDEERKQASEQDKVLDARRQILIGNNDKLKQKLSEAKEVTKARLEFETQRGILLKRVIDNNLKIEEGSNTKDSDIGVNALQTRLKKGLRLATEDLEQYRKQVRATLDGSMKYVDEQGNKVKVDVTQMTDYVQKFDANIEGTITSIDQLYQTNYISGSEAAKKLKEVLDVNKNEMDIGTYITAVNQSVEYMRQGSKTTIDLLNIEGETRRAMLDSGVTSTRETNAAIRKLNQAKLQEEINQQKQLIEFTKFTSSVEQKKLDAAKLKLLQQQLVAEQRSSLKAELEDRFKQQQLALDKEKSLIDLNRAKYLTTEEEFNKQLSYVRKKDLINKQEQLVEQFKLVKNDKEQQAQIQKELVDLQLEYQRIITDDLERELTKRSKQLENNINKTSLKYRELLNVINNNAASLEEENKIYESRNKITAVSIEYESGKLNNSLRVTADIEKRAAIETKILELREQNRTITETIERNSLTNQQKSLQLSLQRQQIELDTRKFDAINNAKLLQLELELAIKRKSNVEDIEAIKIKLDSNKQEQNSITKQNELLQVTKRNQSEIAVNLNKELSIKQEIAREGGLLDLQIAKQNEILVKYEKAAQLANIEASIAETTANKQQVAADIQIKSYETRLSLLNKQLELEQQNQEQVQRQFKLAEGLAVNDYQKRKLAEQAAKQELLNLGKKQQIEQQVLEINIKSNKLALQRSIIEQEVAKVKLAAEIKVQEAETNKVLASKTSTDEEKKASLATLDAKRFALEAKQYEDVFIQQRQQLLNADEDIQRGQLNIRQRNERQDKTIAYAKTTFTTSDDRAIYRALKDSLSPLTKVLDTIRINKDEFANLFSYPQQQSVNLEASKFDFKLGQPRVNKTNDGKQVIINFTPTTNIEVKGDGSTKEFGKQLKAESDSWIKGLHDTLRKVNVELGN